MKRKVLTIISFVFLFFFSASAYDYEADGLYYNIDAENGTASITSGENQYTGIITIPDIISVKGKEIKVTAINDSFSGTPITSISIGTNISEIPYSAFQKCESLTHIEFRDTSMPITLRNKYIYNDYYANAGLFYTLPIETIYIGRPIVSNGAYSDYGNGSPWSPFLYQNYFGSKKCENLRKITFGGLCETIPENFCEYSVLTEIELGKNIKKIESKAFSNCSIESIYIESIDNYAQIVFESTPQIGSNLFYKDDLIQEVTLNISNISSQAFHGVKSIKNIKLGDQVSYIGQYAFAECEELEKIEIISQDTKLDYRVFYNNASLTSLNAPNLTDIGKGSFETCVNLNYVNIPNIMDLEEDAFLGCENLNSLNFPYLNKIGRNAFKNTGLKEITLPSIITISDYSFSNCNDLTNIELGIKIQTLGELVFNDCSNLQSITVKAANPPIAKNTFTNNQYVNTTLNVPSLSYDKYTNTSPWSNFFEIKQQNLNYIESDNCLFYVEGDNAFLISLINKDVDALIIPNNIKYNNQNINVNDFLEDCFSGCQSLTTLKFSSNFKSLPPVYELGSLITIDFNNIRTIIPDSYCKGLSNLTSVNSIENIISIGSEAFSNCSSLNHIPLGNSLIQIDDKAFAGCKNLQELILPSSLEVIGNDILSGCSSLKSIVFETATSPIQLGYNTSLVQGSSITPYPNASTVDEKRTGFRNCYYDGLFYGLPIEDLIINRNIELPLYYERKIGNKSGSYETVYNDIVYYPPFYGLKNLKSVEIGENVTSICQNTIDVVMNAVPTVINYTNFGQCDNIQTVISKNTVAPVGGGFSQSAYENATLYLPNGGKASYQRDEYWKNFVNIIEGNYIPVESIKIEQESVELPIEGTLQLKLIVNPENATYTSVSWVSSNEKIVTVSETGVLTGIAEGSATVTATIGNIETTCEVSVYNPIVEAESIILNIEESQLYINETLQLEATVLPENTTDKSVIWQSSNIAIATVNESGLVTAISEGATTITATNGNISTTCQITVLTPIIEAEQIILNLESAELNVGETVQLEATVLPEDTTDKSLSWNSSDPNIATVSDEGLVTAVSAGTTIITTTCGDISAECAITVLEDAGVENLLANPELKISIYSTEGILIKKDGKVEDLKILNKGIYIIVSGKEHYKISI